eukprot:9894474-Lingulodinium_polyedra.AAC.1
MSGDGPWSSSPSTSSSVSITRGPVASWRPSPLWLSRRGYGGPWPGSMLDSPRRRPFGTPGWAIPSL